MFNTKTRSSRQIGHICVCQSIFLYCFIKVVYKQVSILILTSSIFLLTSHVLSEPRTEHQSKVEFSGRHFFQCFEIFVLKFSQVPPFLWSKPLIFVSMVADAKVTARTDALHLFLLWCWKS